MTALPPTAQARIRFLADWISSSLTDYAAAPPDYEQTHRVTYRNWLTGATKAEREAYRSFLNSGTCNFELPLGDGTQHPKFEDLYGPINAAIEGFNNLTTAKFATLPEDTPPTCKKYVEQPDGTVVIEYNWELDLLAGQALPAFPFPVGSFRVHVQYAAPSES